MLHALAAVALCLFIGERLVRYWSAWRLHRGVRRSLDTRPLYQEAQPSRWPDVGRLVAWAVACVAIIATVILAT
jgi:hypothetical protein